MKLLIATLVICFASAILADTTHSERKKKVVSLKRCSSSTDNNNVKQKTCTWTAEKKRTTNGNCVQYSFEQKRTENNGDAVNPTENVIRCTQRPCDAPAEAVEVDCKTTFGEDYINTSNGA